MNNNISVVSNDATARTQVGCATQRAEYLTILGTKKVLELCVGPSLKTLETEYNKYDIEVSGNDIDIRWKRYYPAGRWHMGDAFALDYSAWDAVVFAPPLTKGCTGRREDALRINEVRPGYRAFIDVLKRQEYRGIAVLVLPGRAKADPVDRQQYADLISYIWRQNYFMVDECPLSIGARRTVKYTDLYLTRGNND